MKRHLLSVCLFMSLVVSGLFGQTPKDATVALSTVVSTATPGVSITWQGPTPADSFIVARREKDSPNWFYAAIGLSAANGTTTVNDPTVVVGKSYEYFVQQRAFNKTIFQSAYACVSVDAAATDSRGKLLLLIESALANPLATEISTLEDDLVGDGWTVIKKYVAPTETVATIKSMIVSEYNADPTNVKSVFLLGQIPVPYSGSGITQGAQNFGWDGHTDHGGAWPADAFYGDMNGIWTDATVNNTTPTRSANKNIPGDGKYDQTVLPSQVELAVGRVDFKRLTGAGWGLSVTELLRRYLNKNHAWRTGQFQVSQKALVDDNFGWFSGEAFAQSGFRNAYPLVGAGNIVETDFFNNTNPQSYLMAYATGPGGYSSAGGVGSSSNFMADTVNAVFTNLFGSYFGDWDFENDPFMPSALASKGGILNCGWSGRPTFFLQSLAYDEPIGHAMKETTNAAWNVGFFGSFGESGAHVSLLGDPTIRANYVQPIPPNSITMNQNCETVEMVWDTSTAANKLGYQVFRATSKAGPYTLLTPTPITGKVYTDENVPVGDLYYMVRVVAKTSSPGGGIYTNRSTGVISKITTIQTTPPTVTATGGLLDCSNTSVELMGTSSLGGSLFTWIGPNNFYSNDVNPIATEAGEYELDVIAPNGCIVIEFATVDADFTQPDLTVSSIGKLNCTLIPVQLNASSMVSGATYLWTGPGVSSTNSAISVSVVGTYSVVVTGPNGCTTTDNIILPGDFAPPTAEAGPEKLLTCINPTATLDGSSATPGASFSWEGPNGFTSNLQNPTVAEAGSYTLYVTGPNGCQQADAVVVSIDNATLTIPALPSETLSCAVPCVTLFTNIAGFPFPICYEGPGISGNCPTDPLVCVAGNYLAIVTNPANGCTTSAPLEINSDGSTPNVAATGSELTCAQTSVELNGSSTSNVVSFTWSGPLGYTSNEPNPTVSESGTYTLVVTADNGCTSSAQAVVSSNTASPNITATASNVLTCTVLEATLSATSDIPGTVFSFPNGNVTVSVSGSYSILATAPNGCTSSTEAIVSEDVQVPDVSLTPSNVLTCSTPTATLIPSSNTAGVVFSWPNGIDMNPVVATAPNGCTNTATADFVEDFTAPTLSVSPQTATICPGGCATIQINASADATISGCTSFPCEQVICQPGNYIIVATGQNGCSTSSSVSIEQSPAMSLSLSLSTDCDGLTTPSIAVSGGVAPFSYAWTPQPPLPPNTDFTIIVTDGNGCTISETGNSGPAPAPLVASATMTAETIGSKNGTATATATGGTTPYSYNWSDGQTSQTATGLATGLISCTITDANGCQTVVTIFVEGISSSNEPSIMQNISLSPNPTNGQANLFLSLKNAASVQIEIRSAAGQLLTQLPENQWLEGNQSLDLSEYPSGVYFVNILIDGQPVSRKLTVLK